MNDGNEDTAADGREIADLLPFYAVGTLGAAETRRVADALATHPDLRRELDLVVEERQIAIEANEAMGMPSPQARDRLFAMLGAQEPRRNARFDLPGWIAARLEALTPRTLAWSTLAVVAVIIAQTGIIGFEHAPKPGFETASVTAPASTDGAPFIVAFAPDARAADIANLLQDTHATIVAGPLPGGLYQLRVGDHALSAAESEAIAAKLKAKPTLVRFVAAGSGSD